MSLIRLDPADFAALAPILGEDTASLAQIQVSPEIKKAILGVMLLNAVGKGVLEAAAKSLVESRPSQPSSPQSRTGRYTPPS